MTGEADRPPSRGTSARDAGWSFSFVESDEPDATQPAATQPPAAHPPAAIADELEFAKSTLQHELAGVARTSLHLQSLLRRAHRDGITADEIAVHAGLSIETVRAVLAGAPLVDQLFGAGSSPAPRPRGSSGSEHDPA